jgi:hypothetical protein
LSAAGRGTATASHPQLGLYRFYVGEPCPLLFCDNETNSERLYGHPNGARYPKDAFHDYVVGGIVDAVNPESRGTKCAAHCYRMIEAHGSIELRFRLSAQEADEPFECFEETFARRIREADEFYARLQRDIACDDTRAVQRQALAGMIWSKQYFYYDVAEWLKGDPAQPPPPPSRGRNAEWTHLNNADILSMPDKWEYPWYAAWDLAFHAIPLALVDAEFAKHQLLLLTREWYMHPNGQLPAYEWAFGDVNPPVHAWATWRVFQMDRKQRGDAGDLEFLERVFHKLMLNFTWWVNRKDEAGNNVFEGGFLGLDNIGVFDRSQGVPGGGVLEQADGTSWMAFFSAMMMQIAIELALEKPVYEAMACKFYEHFVWIASAMDRVGEHHDEIWDEQDGFFYDVLRFPNGHGERLKVRSMVGLLALAAIAVIPASKCKQLPRFMERIRWFSEQRQALLANITNPLDAGPRGTHLLSLLNERKLRRILARMLDPNEFLSDYGIRALSRYHLANPYNLTFGRNVYRVQYEPAESTTRMFGGNSNWRGPVWFPVNLLMVRALVLLHAHYGPDFQVECPTGSGQRKNLGQVALELSRRLSSIFLRNSKGRRPVYGDTEIFQTDPHWRDLVLFYEYFHGDNGAGIGASHQTGWTGIVARLIQLYLLKADADITEDSLPKALASRNNQ